MGMVMRVKCTKPGHPRPDKDYALKVVFNFGAETYSAVRNLYTAEFEAVSSIPRHRNITPYWAQFRDTVPASVRAAATAACHSCADATGRVLCVLADGGASSRTRACACACATVYA